jgi:CHAT domain-containing protein
MSCHAKQEHADPDRSGFTLWDGTLSVSDLAILRTPGRDLAFLSACQTATGSISNVDEALHLAAAMQFLAYQQVVATLWAIADSPAPHVADAVYATLTRDGTPNPGLTAEALHRAIHGLRNADPTDPLLWAPTSTSAPDPSPRGPAIPGAVGLKYYPFWHLFVRDTDILGIAVSNLPFLGRLAQGVAA